MCVFFPSELKLKSSLILEGGPLPSSSEIYLRISQVFDGVSKKNGETRGLLCGVSQSLRELKRKMKVQWDVPAAQDAWVRRAGKHCSLFFLFWGDAVFAAILT